MPGTFTALSWSPVRPTLPAVDLERAKSFYEEKLGLVAMPLDIPGLAMYHAGNGTALVLYQREVTKADHTVASFEVADIHQAVSDLRTRGVVFEEYNLPHIKTVNGIAAWGREKAAWFKDSEGNIIGLNERRSPPRGAAATSISMSRIAFLIIGLIVVLGALGLTIWGIGALNKSRDSGDGDQSRAISNFEECVAAGYPIAESYPRQCHTPDGQSFTENIDEPSGEAPDMSERIETPAGVLTLSWADGWAKLEGTLARSTPCVNWQVKTTQSSSGIEFDVVDSNKGVVCIQVLGTPQNISTLVQTSSDTNFVVKFEGETKFSGTL
jgi:predicted enzyme related to lactoylglutathione lyase